MRSESNSKGWLDGALYPDRELPVTLETLAERVDFLARLCAAWDLTFARSQYRVRDPSVGVARGGGCLSSADLANLPPAAKLARSAALALFGTTIGLHPR